MVKYMVLRAVYTLLDFYKTVTHIVTPLFSPRTILNMLRDAFGRRDKVSYSLYHILVLVAALFLQAIVFKSCQTFNVAIEKAILISMFVSSFSIAIAFWKYFQDHGEYNQGSWWLVHSGAIVMALACSAVSFLTFFSRNIGIQEAAIGVGVWIFLIVVVLTITAGLLKAHGEKGVKQ
jgi:hypothetical protein